MREAHTAIDPELVAVDDDPGHAVALPAAAGDAPRELWRELRAGAQPEQARERVAIDAPEGEPDGRRR